MGEDASHAERSSNRSSPASPVQQQENTELLIPSFSPSSAPSSPTNTLSRLGLKTPTSPSPTSPTDRSQVSAITVVALLDKLVNMLEAVQENQRRMEQRQADLEGAVLGVQGDVTRLSKSHSSTSNSVSKLLERSRKVSGNLKEVRERMDKQAVQVKRLEANHSHLLKRNHFKVLIFQEDNEIPSSVFVKDSMKVPQSAPQPAPQPDEEASSQTAPSVTAETNHSREEVLQTISLSSDEDDEAAALREQDELLEGEAAMRFGASHSTLERSRTEKLKRSSLKKVDSLKKAFSRQSIEKKMSKIGTKIVPPERREKIRKSFTPNHPKSPAAKSSSFKVSPMTFNVKKVRDGEAHSQPGGSPAEIAHVEIPPLGSLDGESTEVHSQESLEGAEGRWGEEVASPSTPGSGEVELILNGEAGSLKFDLSLDRPAELAVPENDEEEEEEEVEKVEKEEKEKEEEEEKGEPEPEPDKEEQSAVEDSASLPAAAVPVEPAS
ncbi:caveolae-associated protein 2a [Osmerus mordax]|uniref:caveolae-associated protein 2a n=1 Tax=Osmerus mordax TaxID=8014 RepID=UPI0035101176